MELLSAIRRIIARKIVERREPHIATVREVFELTGKSEAVQLDEAEPLLKLGLISIGKTFNDMYYKLKNYG